MNKEFEFQRRVTAAMEAGVAMSKRDWAIAAVCHREKNESLRAELAAKDKRIESLEQTLENALHGRREFINKFRERPVLITTEQINTLWRRRSFYIPFNKDPIDDCLSAINIVACHRCSGTNSFMGDPCTCPNNGWMIGGDND